MKILYGILKLPLWISVVVFIKVFEKLLDIIEYCEKKGKKE